MKTLLLPMACVALFATPCFAQFGTMPPNMLNNPGALLPPQGVVGNPGTMPVLPGGFAGGMNGSGFVPGGQNMGGQGMSLNTYFGLRMLQGMAGRHSSGPHYGVSNPFVTPNDPYNAAYQQQPQSSLKPPKNIPVKMNAEERRAQSKRLAEERKAHAAELAAEKKAKAAQKKVVAKKDG